MKAKNNKRKNRKKKAFTIQELVLAILIIALLSSISIMSFGRIAENAKIKATQREMAEIAQAILGDPQAGTVGYMSDMGDLPTNLNALYMSNASPYNPFTRTGWNGPYIDVKTESDGSISILNDAWGHPYGYSKANKKIWSWGPDEQNDNAADDDIVVDIQ